jgi:hypothetical protein
MRFLLRLIVWLLLCILTALLIGLPFLGFLGAGAITDSPVVAGAIAVAVLLGAPGQGVNPLFATRLPAAADRIGSSSGKIQTRERLGGLLKFYHREAA